MVNLPLTDCSLGLFTFLLYVEKPFNLCQVVGSDRYVAPFFGSGARLCLMQRLHL